MNEADQGEGIRMEPLATLPVFFKLRGRPVVMAGGTLPAVWKAELIAAAGAMVRVFAVSPCPEMIALAQAAAGSITLRHRDWQPADLDGAAFAIGDVAEGAEADAFRSAAHGAGVPVNIIDKPAYCDFQFGTIVARSPLVIGISTDGAAPVFGQALRARIEALLPQGLRMWAQAAKDWRPAVQSSNLDFRRRRRFWEVFTDRALRHAERAPTSEDQRACFSAIDSADHLPAGRLTLVGSGIGDTTSLTLGAIGVLQSADVVLHDDDVSDTAVAMARREAEKARIASAQRDPPSDLRRLLAEGKHVAWLGTGNPDSCLKWNARVASLRATHIAAEIEPGLNSCPACPKTCRFPAPGGG